MKNVSKVILGTLSLYALAFAGQASAAITVGSTSISTDGALAINGVAGSTYALGAATTTGTITIGGTAQTGDLVMGQSSATNNVLVGTGSGATTIQMASGNTSSNVIIGQTTSWNGAKVDIRHSQTSAFTSGLSVYADKHPASSGSNASTAVNFTTSSHGSGINYTGYLNTLQLEADVLHTGTLGTLENLYLYTYNSNSTAILTTYGIFNVMQSDTGTLTSAYLINNDLTVNGGTISNAYQVYNGNPAGAGTITNNYSIYVAGQTKGTNNVGIVVGEATGTKQTNILVGTTTQPTGSYSIYNVSVDGNLTAGPTNYGATATSTTAFTLAVPLPALTDGVMVTFKVHAASTGASTLNVNSLGAKKLLKGSDNATQINSGELVVNGSYMAIYNSSLDSSAGAWVVIGK